MVEFHIRPLHISPMFKYYLIHVKIALWAFGILVDNSVKVDFAMKMGSGDKQRTKRPDFKIDRSM